MLLPNQIWKVTGMANYVGVVIVIVLLIAVIYYMGKRRK